MHSAPTRCGTAKLAWNTVVNQVRERPSRRMSSAAATPSTAEAAVASAEIRAVSTTEARTGGSCHRAR